MLLNDHKECSVVGGAPLLQRLLPWGVMPSSVELPLLCQCREIMSIC